MFTKLFLLLLACSCGITDILAEHNVSFLIKTKSCGCGIEQGSEMVQVLTWKFKCISGTHWDELTHKLYFADRQGGSVSKYNMKKGTTTTLHIKELRDQQIAATYPIHKRKNQCIVAGNNTLYLFKTEYKDNDITYTIKEILKVTDGSQIITNTITTYAGNLIITTKPANKKEGEGQLLRVNMTSQKVETLDTGFDMPAGVCFGVYSGHLYVSDAKQGKIWQYKHNVTNGKISDKKVIFDMKYQNLTVYGKISAITMDREGLLWIGMCHSYQVLVYDIHLRIIVHKIPISTSVTSSLAWGGKHHDTLFVGTSKKLVKDPKREDAAGSLLAISGTGSKGFPIPRIRVPDNIQ